jgi:hypothetical protein
MELVKKSFEGSDSSYGWRKIAHENDTPISSNSL